MSRPLALAVLALRLLSAPCARADVGDSEASYDPGRAERRSDFAAGLTLGGAFGDSTGYPNELAKIDVPAFEASTGLGAGAAGSVWVGVALRDWFTFGVGMSSTTVSGAGFTSRGVAYVLHLEGYPLFMQGGAFRDLGVLAEFGAGGRTMSRGSVTAAEGGAMSVVGVGVVYEALRLGAGVSLGPAAVVSRQFSPSLSATLATLGVRIAFYGGPG